jgi:hypothetical protein
MFLIIAKGPAVAITGCAIGTRPPAATSMRAHPSRTSCTLILRWPVQNGRSVPSDGRYILWVWPGKQAGSSGRATAPAPRRGSSRDRPPTSPAVIRSLPPRWQLRKPIASNVIRLSETRPASARAGSQPRPSDCLLGGTNSGTCSFRTPDRNHPRAPATPSRGAGSPLLWQEPAGAPPWRAGKARPLKP